MLKKIRIKSLFIHFLRVFFWRKRRKISFSRFSFSFPVLSRLSFCRLLCRNAGRANEKSKRKMVIWDTVLGAWLLCMRALILVITKRGNICWRLRLSMWSMWRQRDLCGDEYGKLFILFVRAFWIGGFAVGDKKIVLLFYHQFVKFQQTFCINLINLWYKELLNMFLGKPPKYTIINVKIKFENWIN